MKSYFFHTSQHVLLEFMKFLSLKLTFIKLLNSVTFNPTPLFYKEKKSMIKVKQKGNEFCQKCRRSTKKTGTVISLQMNLCSEC